jgi:uncharacterized membrane protein YgdD (TMEM256/DUF423 family)
MRTVAKRPAAPGGTLVCWQLNNYTSSVITRVVTGGAAKGSVFGMGVESSKLGLGRKNLHMRNGWLSIAGILGALGVILGAFGAHGLKGRLTQDLLATFEVGVRYHMYHALALLVVALAMTNQGQNRWLTRACAAWAIGIAIFSGSLYALALTNARWLGAITPIGGVAFIAGWCFLVMAGLRGGAGNKP